MLGVGVDVGASVGVATGARVGVAIGVLGVGVDVGAGDEDEHATVRIRTPRPMSATHRYPRRCSGMEAPLQVGFGYLQQPPGPCQPRKEA